MKSIDEWLNELPEDIHSVDAAERAAVTLRAMRDEALEAAALACDAEAAFWDRVCSDEGSDSACKAARDIREMKSEP